MMATVEREQNNGSPSPEEPLNPESMENEKMEVPGGLEGEPPFDLQVVLDGFKACRKPDGEIHMEGYLRAYSEIIKLIELLGSVFTFVASDVKKKVTILQCYCKGGAGDYYYSLASMIEYEKDNNLLTSTTNPSGARTLLRLHRALDFTRNFLLELHKVSPETGLGSLTRDVYNRALANYHSWSIRQTVKVATLVMSTKEVFVDQLTGGDEKVKKHFESIVLEAVEVMGSVYNATQKLYEEYDLLDLP
ncbi:ceramide-1-phosphate transfer protein [Oratosquilla oratoria]|uniref:ceramide-1-phosphate transfer protein n=1 Tax=Oratosquilla oratoria TaxID=337810 RepID=UPI003F771396